MKDNHVLDAGVAGRFAGRVDLAHQDLVLVLLLVLALVWYSIV